MKEKTADEIEIENERDKNLYMQGYEDGKKLKRSAVACVIENQQYYIIKKEIEHYKEYIEKLQKENEELKKLHIQDNKHLDFIMKHSISVQKVKDRIEKYKKLSDKFYVKFLESDRYNTDIREKGIKCDAIILALEELIEEREEK